MDEGERSRLSGPSPSQRASYDRDGFVVLDSWLATDDVAACQEAFDEIFAHRWATGVAPDEVNYTAGVTPPDHTRQMCNGWKASPVIARIVLAQRTAAFAASLEGLDGMRILQDNCIWKPPGGKALVAHRDCEYLGYLDPPNMTSCWTALDDTHADTGTIYYVRGSHRWPATDRPTQFHAPDDWLAHVRANAPVGVDVEDLLVPVEVPAGGAAFHKGWTFHGSPPNEREDRERRAVVAHLGWSGTRHHPTNRDPVYSRYLRPGSTELDEAFFPILWHASGHRTAWLP